MISFSSAQHAVDTTVERLVKCMHTCGGHGSGYHCGFVEGGMDVNRDRGCLMLVQVVCWVWVGQGLGAWVQMQAGWCWCSYLSLVVTVV